MGKLDRIKDSKDGITTGFSDLHFHKNRSWGTDFLSWDKSGKINRSKSKDGFIIDDAEWDD